MSVPLHPPGFAHLIRDLHRRLAILERVESGGSSSGGVGPQGPAGIATYATLVGDGTSTSFTVTHNLGTRDVVWVSYDATSYADDTGVTAVRTTANILTVTYPTAPAAGGKRVVVQGHT